jgi:hypothetical protein
MGVRVRAASARDGRVFRAGCLLALLGTCGGASARKGRFDRLRGYFVSPIRSHEILPVWLPGMILENNMREKVG